MKPYPVCLNVTENGAITLTKPADLFLASQDDPWNERTAEGVRQLTAASISAAVMARRSHNDFLISLREQLTHTLQPLLELALRAWSEERPAGLLEIVLVLRCPQPAVTRAITESALFRPAIRGC